MEVNFKAKDGTIFDSAEDCVYYEVTLKRRPDDWEGGNWDGDRTNDTSEAVVVKLNTEDAAEQFLAQAKLDEDDKINGIEIGDEGWFYYDQCGERYIQIDETIICIFMDYFKS